MSGSVIVFQHRRTKEALDDMNADADWYFMAADMTSLPALSVKISKLPGDAKGYAIIKVASEHDKQVLNAPTGMQVEWITENTKLAVTPYVHTLGLMVGHLFGAPANSTICVDYFNISGMSDKWNATISTSTLLEARRH